MVSSPTQLDRHQEFNRISSTATAPSKGISHGNCNGRGRISVPQLAHTTSAVDWVCLHPGQRTRRVTNLRGVPHTRHLTADAKLPAPHQPQGWLRCTG